MSEEPVDIEQRENQGTPEKTFEAIWRNRPIRGGSADLETGDPPLHVAEAPRGGVPGVLAGCVALRPGVRGARAEARSGQPDPELSFCHFFFSVAFRAFCSFPPLVA